MVSRPFEAASGLHPHCYRPVALVRGYSLFRRLMTLSSAEDLLLTGYERWLWFETPRRQERLLH